MVKIFTPRKPKRLKTRDYAQQGYYYITVCTYNRLEVFGTIENNKILLNQWGNIARDVWLDLPNHHKNIKLDEFIIMPNHIHAMLNAIVGGGAGPPPYTKKKKIIPNYTSY